MNTVVGKEYAVPTLTDIGETLTPEGVFIDVASESDAAALMRAACRVRR